jgi:hypothetical protein
VKIDLQIERLVLEGISLSPFERRVLQASVEVELARLLKRRELSRSLDHSTSVPLISTDGILLAVSKEPKLLGQQIAQSVYGGISHD